MKQMMNFTTSADDTTRYQTAQELRAFYESFHLDGLELMPFEENHPLIEPDMVIGIHMRCLGDWMGQNRKTLLEHYRKDLDYAQKLQAQYVVFHVTQVNDEESFTYQMQHRDEEVIDAACSFINELLDNQNYTFDFLMENLWWPGLNLQDPKITQRLLDGVHYPQKGLMLDTGHYLHTNHCLQTQEEALAYLQAMLDAHQDLLPYFKGIHLQQSLTSTYIQDWLKTPHILEEDPEKRFCQVFEHIFRIDLHQPFTTPEIRQLIERISPAYLTYEYITTDKQQMAEYLQAGIRALT